MADEAWRVSADTLAVPPSILSNSALPPEIIARIMAGEIPLPRSNDVPLTPARELLHELIVQTVTERRLPNESEMGYDKALFTEVSQIISSDAYQQLARANQFSREDVGHLLDQFGLEHLPAAAPENQTTLMLASGGPATGKSTLVRQLANEYPEIYVNAAKVNTDDYKPILVSTEEFGSNYSNIAHAESALITDRIMTRLIEMDAQGKAPHVVLDVVSMGGQRMAFANLTEHLIVASGTAPPEVTVERSYQRGLETERFVPTGAVLGGAKVVSQSTPQFFEHPHLDMTLYDTNVPFGAPIEKVAEWSGQIRALNIVNPDAFIDFVERQNLNPKAASPDQLFAADDRSPQRIAENLSAYTDRGVTLTFLNEQGDMALVMAKEGVAEFAPLHSARGADFFPALAGASTALIEGRRALASEEHKTGTSSGRGSGIANGVGVGLGAKGLYDDLIDPDSPLQHDLEAGGAQAGVGVARTATLATDVIIGTAATIEGTRRGIITSSSVATAVVAPHLGEGALAKLAGRAALPLAVGAGALEATAGVLEDNPERVAGAIGSTGGGILGGIIAGAGAGALAGAATGSPSGPGATITAFGGAVIGAIAGGYYGEEIAKEWLTDSVDTVMGVFRDEEPRQTIESPTISALPPDMQKALEAAGGISLSNDIVCSTLNEYEIAHGLTAAQEISRNVACGR